MTTYLIETQAERTMRLKAIAVDCLNKARAFYGVRYGQHVGELAEILVSVSKVVDEIDQTERWLILNYLDDKIAIELNKGEG